MCPAHAHCLGAPMLSQARSSRPDAYEPSKCIQPEAGGDMSSEF